MWKDAKAIAGDLAPDAMILTGTPVVSLAASWPHLFASRGKVGAPGGIIFRFDAQDLTSTSTPAVSVARPGVVTTLIAGADDLLFSAERLGNVEMWSPASKLTDASAPTATFVHSSQQLPSVAFESASDRLFGGQMSGAGTLAWNGASKRTGTVVSDFKVADGAYSTMQISGDRLYAGGTHGDGTAGVALWSMARQVAGATAPVLLTKGYQAGKLVSHLVVRGGLDVLVVAARDQNQVFVYTKASSITADRAADFTINAADRPEMSLPRRVAVDGNGRLYVTDNDGILVFKDVATNPTFVTELKSGISGPTDVLVLEGGPF